MRLLLFSHSTCFKILSHSFFSLLPLSSYSNYTRSRSKMSAPSFQVTTASPASGSSIQPMHSDSQSAAEQPQGTGQLEQGHAPLNLGAKGFLMKKMAASG